MRGHVRVRLLGGLALVAALVVLGLVAVPADAVHTRADTAHLYWAGYGYNTVHVEGTHLYGSGSARRRTDLRRPDGGR